MASLLHIALVSCPDYILREAEILISRLGELAPHFDAICLRLSRSSMFYQADIRLDYPGKNLISQSQSRYLNDALEDSFTKIVNLACSFIVHKNIKIPREAGGYADTIQVRK